MQRSYNNQNLLSLTNIIVFITVLVFILEDSIENASLLFGLNLNFTVNDFWWQPLSSMFMHGDFTHILMNMFMLFIFGSLIENAKGKLEFFILYFVCGILTSLFSYAYIYFIDPYINIVGASGALCAIMGYIAFFDKQRRSGMFVWVGLISFVPLLVGLPVAWFAHIIGFVLGYIYAIIRK